ncbi:MAG: DUF2232 domain-containing protein [Tissierella sp.]|nr:DUF2232 domain-containing protein [Tissierella sp.]
MNQGKDNRKSLESIALTGIMSVFFMFSIYYFEVLLFLFPVAFIAFGVKHDLFSSLLSLVTTLLIIGLLLSPAISLSYFLLFGPLIALSIYLIKKRTRANQVVLYSALVLFIAILILLGILNYNGVDLISQFEEQFSMVLSGHLDYLKDMGFTTYELLETRDSLKSEYEKMMILIPAVILITSSIISYINYQLITFGLKKVEIRILQLPRFLRFRLPDNFTIGALLMVVTAFFISMMNISYSDVLYVNIIVLLGSVLFLQGLAIVSFFLTKIKTKKFLRVITYLIILFSPQISSIMALLGGIDIIFDLRKIKGAKSV